MAFQTPFLYNESKTEESFTLSSSWNTICTGELIFKRSFSDKNSILYLTLFISDKFSRSKAWLYIIKEKESEKNFWLAVEYGHQFLDSFLDFILKPNFENLFVKFRSNFGQDIFFHIRRC